jgi:uncharacterized repeat protein (TIGR03803 family)
MSENALRRKSLLHGGVLGGIALLAAALQNPAAAQGFSLQTLYSFCTQPRCVDGKGPGYGSLVEDSSGNLYGTTQHGGRKNAGTVFQLDGSGTESVLHNFCTQSQCSDGRRPLGGVVISTAGNLGRSGLIYGTTHGRGSLTGGARSPGGVFAILTDGQEVTLTAFCDSSTPDCAGEFPTASLLVDAAGSFYGTTSWGGTNYLAGFYCCGTVFKVVPGQPQTVLYSFCSAADCSDGARPEAPLIADGSGNLYGTTVYGGRDGGGTVFEITAGGTEKVLYNFCSALYCTDGLYPHSGLVMDGSGNLYGTTTQGGQHNGGTVFKLTPGGSETVLYSFCAASGCGDGSSPQAGLVMDGSGNLYGTTESGGSKVGGTVFQVTPDGQETVLYSFCSVAQCCDGKAPRAGLLMDKSGNLFGTTSKRGANGIGGTVFKLVRR